MWLVVCPLFLSTPYISALQFANSLQFLITFACTFLIIIRSCRSRLPFTPTANENFMPGIQLSFSDLLRSQVTAGGTHSLQIHVTLERRRTEKKKKKHHYDSISLSLFIVRHNYVSKKKKEKHYARILTQLKQHKFPRQ